MSDFSPVLLRSGTPARSAWPFAGDVVPLNHGSFGAVPSPIVAARDALLRRADASPVGWFPHVPDHVRDARERIAAFVGATPDRTVFVPNASAGASVVTGSLVLSPGDEILVTDHGYGAITMGAERLARRFGAVVRTVPIGLDDDDDAVIDAFHAALTERVRLVVVDQITSATARTLPTAAITVLAHTVGARVLVDGAHAPGLVADAAAVAGADWWVGNLHKWPCAPRGAALLVTADDDTDALWPLIDSWGGDQPFPDRFDSQGTGDVSTYLTAPDAVDWIEREHGWDRARATMTTIADAMADTVADALQPMLDFSARLPAHTPSMRLFPLPAGLGSTVPDANALRERLYEQTRIEAAFTSFRGAGYLRLSAHLYTTPDDVSAFVDRAVPLLRTWAGRA